MVQVGFDNLCSFLMSAFNRAPSTSLSGRRWRFNSRVVLPSYHISCQWLVMCGRPYHRYVINAHSSFHNVWYIHIYSAVAGRSDLWKVNTQSLISLKTCIVGKSKFSICWGHKYVICRVQAVANWMVFVLSLMT